jgi:ribonuclease HI
MSTYRVYTDGAYSSARNQGGIGFVILKDDKEVARYSKMYKNSTNQRMEQMAAIVALESISTPSEVTIISDSQYVVCTYTKNWKRKANLDLWKRFDAAIAFHTKVEFLWVKGHDKDEYNNIADKLASNASQEV